MGSKLLIAGEEDGRSLVVERVDWNHDPRATQLTSQRAAQIEVADPQVRPVGEGDYRDYGIPSGTAHWNQVRWAANEHRAMHYTNTIDAITVVDGHLWLLLDDGEHELSPGDCVLINAVNHGWRTGPEGCSTSNLLFGVGEP